MLILVLKLLLVPSLLATVTLVARRWGANVAGWLASFPIVAGPVLLVLTLEQGAAFGARAAAAAVGNVCVFSRLLATRGVIDGRVTTVEMGIFGASARGSGATRRGGSGRDGGESQSRVCDAAGFRRAPFGALSLSLSLTGRETARICPS